jgi:hypothetical protein
MTLVNLYRGVLDKLGVTAAGESAAPEDTQFVAGKYVSVWNQLKTRGLVSWAVDEPVPDEAADSLIRMVAYAAADEFDEDPADYAAAGAIGLPNPSVAERDLRQLHARDYVSVPAVSEYL